MYNTGMVLDYIWYIYTTYNTGMVLDHRALCRGFNSILVQDACNYSLIQVPTIVGHRERRASSWSPTNGGHRDDIGRGGPVLGRRRMEDIGRGGPVLGLESPP